MQMREGGGVGGGKPLQPSTCEQGNPVAECDTEDAQGEDTVTPPNPQRLMRVGLANLVSMIVY